MYQRPRLSNGERLFLILILPAIAVLAMSPFLLLIFAVSVLPVIIGLYAITKAIQFIRRKRSGDVPSSSYGFKVERGRPHRGIRHHWSVGPQVPPDSGRDLSLGSERVRPKDPEVD